MCSNKTKVDNNSSNNNNNNNNNSNDDHFTERGGEGAATLSIMTFSITALTVIIKM
jgi:hypothetical protein